LSVEEGISICAAGDVWFADHPVCVGYGVRSATRRPGADYLFDNVRHLLREADIAICNLECPLSDAGINRWKLASMEARGRPDTAAVLERAGFNVVNIANNHVMHHGRAGYTETVEHLSACGIRVLGTDGDDGRTQPVQIDKGGARVTLLGFSMRPEERASGAVPYSLRLSEAAVLDEVAAAKPGSDFVVCSMHWGLEFLSVPSPAQVRFAKRIVEAGADVVIGHHSHTLQPAIQHEGALILFSLGNLVFDLWPQDTRYATLARIRLVESRPPEVRFVPLHINRRYQPEEPGPEVRAEIENALFWDAARLDAALAGVTEQEYEARYRQARRRFRYDSYRYFLRNLYRCPPHVAAQSLGRTMLRRLRGE
jgi:poly-gamma-glutamate synthesis protein (capsule biosynthesis protein)